MYVPEHLQEGEFFRGDVSYLSIGIFNTKYALMDNPSVIKVKNSAHVRCVTTSDGRYPKPSELPFSFEIIAPIAAVTIVVGDIPESYLQILDTNEYLMLRKMYQNQ